MGPGSQGSPTNPVASPAASRVLGRARANPWWALGHPPSSGSGLWPAPRSPQWYFPESQAPPQGQ